MFKNVFLIPSNFLFFSVIAIFMLNGCATALSQSAARIIDGDLRTMENCQLLGDVHGSSGWWELGTSAGLENAKNECREKAASMGATHIVWHSISGGLSSTASGTVCFCK